MKHQFLPDPTTPRLWRKVLVHSDRDGRAVVQELKGKQTKGKRFTVASMLLKDRPPRVVDRSHLFRLEIV